MPTAKTRQRAQRLDIVVTERGLAESREKAQRLILAGDVRVDGQVITKSGRTVKAESRVEVRAPERFVGRGGEKLEHAFKTFHLNVKELVCVDIGASTGGFTDCLLQHGAVKVYAVDVGLGQLHWKLRNDPRVVIMDKVNARYLEASRFPDPPAFAVIDVAFISLNKILRPVTNILSDKARLVTLIKPQFEAGRDKVGKGGIVRDPLVRADVVSRIRSFGETEIGLEWLGECESPIRGAAGNIEYLALWQKR